MLSWLAIDMIILTLVQSKHSFVNQTIFFIEIFQINQLHTNLHNEN